MNCILQNWNTPPNSQTVMRHSRGVRAVVGGLALLIAASGCGPSQEELMMRAAQRPRPDEEEVTPPVNTPTVAAQPSVDPRSAAANNPANAAATPASSSPTPQSQPPANASRPAPEVIAEANGLPKVIAERRPQAPLSELERRKRAADNLKEIARGLTLYRESNKRLPMQGIKAQSGVMTLSWRVELLPFLGYQELYKQFNVNEPWDGPNNIKLLDRIPDCFVSPERFDDKTNYLAVSGPLYLFNEDPIYERKVEDGLENTLAVVEANDALAVPWTSPFDYAPEYDKAAGGLGALRPEGTYAIWGNGWTTFIKKGVGDAVFHKAFTYESSDGLQAGQIHNALRVEAIAAVDAADRPASDALALDQPNDPRGEMPAPAAETGAQSSRATSSPETKLPAPSRGAIAAATERVRELYEAKLKKITNLQEKSEVGGEMLEVARSMQQDPAGAYALQTTAINLFADSGDFDQMCRALDEHTTMFEVDAATANADALVQFGKTNGGAMARAVNSSTYLRRALPVIELMVRKDQYEQVIDIAQFALQYEAQTSNREFIADLNRLKTQLTAARNQYRRLSDHLATLQAEPDDPQANFEVGKYIAFIKGDWEAGLPLLLKGSNERLAQLAKADMATGTFESRLLPTADAWWDLGESTTQQLFKGACRQRAAHWYEIAVGVMPDSLSKLHANARLDEANDSPGGSPLAIIEKLAKDQGFDVLQAAVKIQDPQVRINKTSSTFEDEDD